MYFILRKEIFEIMKAIWNNQVIAESDDIINVEGNSLIL